MKCTYRVLAILKSEDMAVEPAPDRKVPSLTTIR